MARQEPEQTADLTGIDLNLLMVLGAFLQSRSMPEVRRKGRLSPRAAVHALARLRAHFADELIIMERRGFFLTPFAEQIRPKVDAALAAINDMLSPAMPSPERFAMAMPDFQAMSLTAQMTAYFRKTSPGCAFRPVIGLTDALQKLEGGEVDLVLGNAKDAPTGFFRRALPSMSTMCLCRKGHPAAAMNRRSDRLAEYVSIRIHTSDQNVLGDVDDGLEQLLPRGCQSLTVPDIRTAVGILAETDAILILPAGAALWMSERHGLDAFAPDLETAPEYRVSLIWHERSHRDAFHASVRNLVPSFVLGNAQPVG